MQRKPRTTNMILDDLDLAAEVLAAEIEFLSDFDRPYPDGSNPNGEVKKLRHGKLVRAHDWLARFITATRGGRSSADERETLSMPSEEQVSLSDLAH
jgi:hypothetical protein